MNKSLKHILQNKSYHFPIFFITLVFLSVYMTLIYEPMYNHPGWDYYFHLSRFGSLITALKEGTFPFYTDYVAALDYGYLSKVFYSDIIMIPFAVLGIATGTDAAYEIMSFTLTILCGLFMYGAMKTICKRSLVAFLSAILYTFSVYRLFDIYNRGAFGEVLAFTFVPLVFWGLYHIIKGDYKKWYIIAIGFSLLIFSHVISTVLTFITGVIILAIYYKPLLKEPKRIQYLCIAGIVTVFITSTYIFPLYEQLQSNFFRYESNDWTLPSRAKLPLEYMLWAVGCGFVYPKEIVIVGIGILLFALIFLRFFIKEKSAALRSVDIGVLIGLFYLIAASFIFPWGRFPFSLLSFIQYPSRLFLFVTFFFSVAGGFYLSQIFRKDKSRIIMVSVVLLSTCAIMFFHSEHYKYIYCKYVKETNEKPDPGNFFYLNGAEYVPDKVPSAYYILSRADSITSLSGQAIVNSSKRNKELLSINISVQRGDSLELPLFYYKGYIATLNSEQVAIIQSNHGLIQIPVDTSGEVDVYYKGTTIQKITWYITILSIFLLCIYIFVGRKRSHKK